MKRDGEISVIGTTTYMGAQRSNDRRCDRWRNVLLSGVKWRVVHGAVGKIGDTRRTVGREEWSAWKLSVARLTREIPWWRGWISLRGNANSPLFRPFQRNGSVINHRPSITLRAKSPILVIWYSDSNNNIHGIPDANAVALVARPEH